MKEWITGRNAVYEVLIARRRDVFRLQIAVGADVKDKLAEIIGLAQKRKLEPVFVNRKQLDLLDENHQGVALEVSSYPYTELSDIFNRASGRNEPLFILLLDIIQNPQNLGTLIRSAEAAGMHGIVIPLARSAGVTPAVVHASVGATEHMLIAQMNLSQAISELHDRDVWVIGLEGSSEAKMVEPEKLGGRLAIVVGSEGEGLRQLTRKQCDELIRLPMKGAVESLNAAVAGSIMIYLSFIENRMHE